MCPTDILTTHHNSALDSPVVIVEVGAEHTAFSIHKGVLCHHSSFFRAALSGDFKEAHEGKVILDEDNAGIFKLVYYWMYLGRLYDQGPDTKKAHEVYRELAELWIFGDKRGMVSLKNDVIDTLHTFLLKAWAFPRVEVIALIYSKTTPTAMLRKIVVEYITETASLQNFIKTCETAKVGLPVDIYHDVINRLGQLRDSEVGRVAEGARNPKRVWQSKVSSQWHEPEEPTKSSAL